MLIRLLNSEDPVNQINIVNFCTSQTEQSRKRKIRTSTNSLGSPSSARWHHLASPGSMAAKRSRGSSARPESEMESLDPPNTCGCMLLKKTSVALSRQTSRTCSNERDWRYKRVSDRSESNLASGDAARYGGMPPCVSACCRVSEVGGSIVDRKLDEVSIFKKF